MEVSLYLPFGDAAGRSVVDMYVEQIGQARSEGFARVWSPQLPWDPDLMTMLAVAFREVPDIEVGSGVLPIQIAHPMLTAQRALTLSLISGGRFKLGLGVSHPGLSDERWGIPWGKPVRRLKEYLDGLQPLLAGEPANAVGQMITTRGEVKCRAHRVRNSTSPRSAPKCYAWRPGAPRERSPAADRPCTRDHWISLVVFELLDGLLPADGSLSWLTAVCGRRDVSLSI